MIGIIVWLLTAASMGWLASVLMHKRDTGLADAAMGFMGACLGELLFGIFGSDASVMTQRISVFGAFAALLGALAMIALVNVFRGERGLSLRDVIENERKKV